MNFIFAIKFLLLYPKLISTYVADPDEDRDPSQLIESRGYRAQIHHVETKDDYILTMFRIVNKSDLAYREKWATSKTPKYPVILQHGLLSSGGDWLIASSGGGTIMNNVTGKISPSNNLGFVLADYGYDVWLSNSRGNTYSRGHKHLDSKTDHKFWKFSYDQMIEFDTPAIIDYVLNATKRETLGWVGHSQGTMMMFGFLSQFPEQSHKIKPFIALAPVARVKEVTAPLRYAAKIPLIQKMLTQIPSEFMPNNPIVSIISKIVCKTQLREICSNLAFMIMGVGSKQLDERRLPVYFAHVPAGTSIQNIIHFGQNVKHGRFAKFDYGFFKNEKIYGSLKPPLYPIEKIMNPHIVLMHSSNDALADPSDVNWLKSQLKVPLMGDHLIPIPSWNHIDFLWGRDAGKYVHSLVLDHLKNFRHS
ncbi:lysosomal acid lipase/cholesteryl ester hydrolase-like [Brevipalpus obovatus]|uniref:lysosomal acid lipase/cholesteryl ester hydrolase-like n=1 Tax=Brevipalpus obovatus TaxID=246614 RepID=UPI003D9E0C26